MSLTINDQSSLQFNKALAAARASFLHLSTFKPLQGVFINILLVE